jgi:Protein of unknown function (DUF3558)
MNVLQSNHMEAGRMKSNMRGARLVVLFLVAVLTACGGSSTKTSNAVSNPASPGTTAASSGGGEKKIDACGLVSDDEAKTVLGEVVTKKGPTSGVGESVCEWDTATEHSITVSVGSPGTAPGDKLTLDPILGKGDPVAALGGKGFYVAGGEVDFAAGNRYNSVQVVSVAGDADRSKAEQLAVELTPKIGQPS